MIDIDYLPVFLVFLCVAVSIILNNNNKKG